MERVVVLGGTGFIGRRLVPALRQSGRAVRVASRNPDATTGAGVEHVRCDLESGEGVDEALEGADLAYFLVHGMAAGRGFAAREKVATENFVRAARRQGVARVIYLGGLYPDGDLSDHLESRRQVGLMLIEGTGALAVRAGVVVGLGGASFDILYALCQRLPLIDCASLARQPLPAGLHRRHGPMPGQGGRGSGRARGGPRRSRRADLSRDARDHGN